LDTEQIQAEDTQFVITQFVIATFCEAIMNQTQIQTTNNSNSNSNKSADISVVDENKESGSGAGPGLLLFPSKLRTLRTWPLLLEVIQQLNSSESSLETAINKLELLMKKSVRDGRCYLDAIFTFLCSYVMCSMPVESNNSSNNNSTNSNSSNIEEDKIVSSQELSKNISKLVISMMNSATPNVEFLESLLGWWYVHSGKEFNNIQAIAKRKLDAAKVQLTKCYTQLLKASPHSTSTKNSNSNTNNHRKDEFSCSHLMLQPLTNCI
jgi:hypothetical protein